MDILRAKPSGKLVSSGDETRMDSEVFGGEKNWEGGLISSGGISRWGFRLRKVNLREWILILSLKGKIFGGLVVFLIKIFY